MEGGRPRHRTAQDQARSVGHCRSRIADCPLWNGAKRACWCRTQLAIGNPQSAIRMVRLQKYLSEAGIASRRASEEVILAGRVRVNGQIVRTLGTKVLP